MGGLEGVLGRILSPRGWLYLNYTKKYIYECLNYQVLSSARQVLDNWICMNGYQMVRIDLVGPRIYFHAASLYESNSPKY